MPRGSLWRPNSQRSSRDDASTLPALLDTIEVPIRRFTADGAYDHRSVYDQLSAAGTENVVIVIPPRRSALSAGPTDGPWAQRDTALERIRQVGRREWRKESGYRQQARVENSFFRYKSVLGGGLKARHGKAQRREVAGVTSSTGWPSWVGRNPALWCPEREVGKAPPLAPQLNHATAPRKQPPQSENAMLEPRRESQDIAELKADAGALKAEIRAGRS